MKPDYVSVGLDANPEYAGMWNLFARAWSRFGVQAVCWFVGTEVELTRAELSQRHGIVYRVDPGKARGKAWAAPYAGLCWGPAQLGGIVMTSGIDQIPLSSRFLDYIEAIPDSSMCAGFAGCHHYIGTDYIPSSHVVASGDTWRRIMRPSRRLADDVLRPMSLRLPTMWGNEWGTDEAFLSHQIAQNSEANVWRVGSEFFEDWDNRRLCRARNDMPDMGKVRSGWYSEAHLHLPLENNPTEWMDAIMEVCL